MTEADLPNNQDQAELQDNQPTLPPSMADSVGGNLAGSILDASSAHATDAPIETSSQNSPEVAINIEEEWLTCAGIAKVLGVVMPKQRDLLKVKFQSIPDGRESQEQEPGKALLLQGTIQV